MPRTTQKQGGPIAQPVEAVSNVTTDDNRAALRTSKVPPDMFEGILYGLDIMIQEETSNPTRRANIQLCRDFVSEHGFPEEDHYVWVKDGVVKFLTEAERSRLPGSPTNADGFLLAAPGWDIY